MTTLLQVEAFIAVVDMGSFDAAARRLGVAQSAVSRQVQAFEGLFREPLYDRSGRSARLTAAGAEALVAARALLRRRDVLAEALSDDSTLQRTLAIGVTELAAMTWLPRFVEAIRQTFPKLELRLETGMAANIYGALEQGRVDLAMVPDAFAAPAMRKLPLASFSSGWYCSPGYAPDVRRIAVEKLSEHTLLTQGSLSGVGMLMQAWLTRNGVRPRDNLTCNSLSALGGMATAGLGLANIPSAVARQLVEVGLLREVKVMPALPRMHYVALARLNAITPTHERVAALARKLCDYETPYQSAHRATVVASRRAVADRSVD